MLPESGRASGALARQQKHGVDEKFIVLVRSELHPFCPGSSGPGAIKDPSGAVMLNVAETLEELSLPADHPFPVFVSTVRGMWEYNGHCKFRTKREITLTAPSGEKLTRLRSHALVAALLPARVWQTSCGNSHRRKMALRS